MGRLTFVFQVNAEITCAFYYEFYVQRLRTVTWMNCIGQFIRVQVGLLFISDFKNKLMI